MRMTSAWTTLDLVPFFQVMNSCWDIEPEDRPTFSQLLVSLSEIYVGCIPQEEEFEEAERKRQLEEAERRREALYDIEDDNYDSIYAKMDC